jgi:hypothetical protein
MTAIRFPLRAASLAAFVAISLASAASARQPYPANWNIKSAPAAVACQFVPGGNRMHRVEGRTVAPAPAAAIYQFRPGSSHMSKVQ